VRVDVFARARYLGYMDNPFAVCKGAFSLAKLLELQRKVISTWLGHEASSTYSSSRLLTKSAGFLAQPCPHSFKGIPCRMSHSIIELSSRGAEWASSWWFFSETKLGILGPLGWERTWKAPRRPMRSAIPVYQKTWLGLVKTRQQNKEMDVCNDAVHGKKYPDSRGPVPTACKAARVPCKASGGWRLRRLR
jgi:hypothetical protein